MRKSLFYFFFTLSFLSCALSLPLSATSPSAFLSSFPASCSNSPSSTHPLQSAKSLFPKAFALSLDATVSLTNGHPETASAQFRRAATLVPSSNEVASVFMSLSADALHRSKNFPEAAATYLEAFSLATNAFAQPLNCCNLLFMAADSFERANQPQKALSFFSSAANLASHFSQKQILPSLKTPPPLVSIALESHFRIALLFERESDFEQAISHYRLAMEHKDFSLYQKAQLGIARCEYRLFNFNQSLLNHPSKCDSLDSYGESVFLRILALSEGLPDYDFYASQAIRLADSFLAFSATNNAPLPFTADICFWRAAVSYNEQDYFSALSLFNTLSTRQPTHPLADRARLFSGISSFSLNDYSAAVKTFASLVKDFPSSPLIPRARLLQARALLALTRFEDAVLVLDDLIEHYPDSSFFVTAAILRGEALRASSGAKNHFHEAALSYAIALSHGSASKETQHFCQQRLEECLRRSQ